MAAPNCAVIFGLVIFLFLPCCIYCEVDQTYIGCYFDTEGNIQIYIVVGLKKNLLSLDRPTVIVLHPLLEG